MEIFLSYRREDSAGHAGRLFDSLQTRFGSEHVFMDVTTIEPGLDFIEAIEQAIDRCDVFIPVIGRSWLTLTDRQGRQRLQQETDPVRLETEAALQRKGIRIIPVLVQGADMPSADELPRGLETLSRRAAQELSDTRWSYDVTQLGDLLDRIRDPRSRAPSHPRATSGPIGRTSTWSWDDYIEHSPHDSLQMETVREVVGWIEKHSDWTKKMFKNQIRFRDSKGVALAVAFWGSEVLIIVPGVHRAPASNPLPSLRGRLAKNGEWVWYIPPGSQVPDLGRAVDFVHEHRRDSSRPAQPTLNLSARFEEEMLAAYDYLKRSGYNATYFLRMIKEHGGHATAVQLLRTSEHLSEGFLKLVEIGELAYSVEALTLRPEFRELFSDEQLDESRRRLRTADFDVDNWEDRPWV